MIKQVSTLDAYLANNKDTHMSMNKSIPRTPKREDESPKTVTEVLNAYKAMPKKLKLNITAVKPNHCICKQVELMPAVTGPDGQQIILLNSSDAGDELVFEVLMIGTQNSDSAMKIEEGDLIVVSNSYATYFKSSTKLEIKGVELPILATISTDSILYKVEYSKI